MHPDVYGEAYELADALASAGLGSRAHEINDAIAGGCTATEILLRLRRALADAETDPLDDDLRARIARLRRHIDGLLQV